MCFNGSQSTFSYHWDKYELWCCEIILKYRYYYVYCLPWPRPMKPVPIGQVFRLLWHSVLHNSICIQQLRSCEYFVVMPVYQRRCLIYEVLFCCLSSCAVCNVSCRLVQTAGSKVRSLGQWAAATCAAPPSVIAGQYATSHCKPLLVMFM